MLENLPAEAASQVAVADYVRYCLRLHVANASWGTRLRYMQAAIAQTLAQRLRLHIETVDIRIRPGEFYTTPPPATPRVLSQANRAYIHQIAGYIDDPMLATALTRLAAAGRTPD